MTIEQLAKILKAAPILFPQATGYQLNDLRGIWQVTLSTKSKP